MTDSTPAFAKMVPGFEFLQNLMKGAGAAMPGMGQWIAPTLDPEELDKRINDLRTVQFWLEQNARLLAATIQGLEVQRMTLSTLKTMNVSMTDLTESLRIRPAPPAAPEPAPTSAPSYFRSPPPPAPEPTPEPVAAAPVAPPGVMDPMQWWSALTQQFTELAANAIKDGASDAARNLAGTMVKQGFDAASQTLQQAASLPAAAARAAAAASQPAASPAPARPTRAATKKAAPASKRTAAAKRRGG